MSTAVDQRVANWLYRHRVLMTFAVLLAQIDHALTWPSSFFGVLAFPAGLIGAGFWACVNLAYCAYLLAEKDPSKGRKR